MLMEERFTKEEWRAYCRRDAEPAFKDHLLRKESDNIWYCGKDGTGFYHFRVVLLKQVIFMYGDIGELILYPSGREAKEWLLKNLGPVYGRVDLDLDYILGKIASSMRERKVFLPKEALRCLGKMAEQEEHDEYGRDEKGVLLSRKMKARWLEIEEGFRCEMKTDDLPPDMRVHAWLSAHFDVYEDFEAPDVCDWEFQAQFQVHALRKFVELLRRTEM